MTCSPRYVRSICRSSRSSQSNRTWKTSLSRSSRRGNEMPTTTAFHSKPPQIGEQGAGGRRRPWVVAATRAVLNETQKGLWLLWGHRTVVLLEILTFVAFSPSALLVGRLLAVFLEGVLIAVVIGVGMSSLLGISIPLRLAGLLPAALTLIDIAGFALLLGGLALALPQIGAIAHLFSGLIFLLNGAFFPLEWFPTWVQTLARFFPTTLGVEAMRKVVLQGQSLSSVWADGTLPWLIIHTAGLAVLGWLVFLLNDRRAMRHGTLR